MEELSFFEQAYRAMATVPFGEVASYSQIARSLGMPRGARIVGWALGALPEGSNVPWWRIVNAKRQLTIVNKRFGPEDQKIMLEQEGRTLSLQDSVYVVGGEDWWNAPVVPPRQLGLVLQRPGDEE